MSLKYNVVTVICCSIMMLGLQLVYYGSQFALQNIGIGPLFNSLILGIF